MGSFNSKYFGTKSGSLEESIRKAVGGIQEKVEYVEYKFRNRNDAMKAKKMLDAVQLMDFEINDDNIRGGELMVDAGNRDMTKYHQEIIKKFRPKVMTTEKLVGGQKKLDKDKDGDIDGKDFAMLRKAKTNKESVEVDEGKMKQMKSYIDDIANAMKKDKMMKPFVSKFMSDVSKSLDPKKSLEKVLPDYIPGKDVSKLLNMGENYDVGTPENTKAKLDATPGQSQDDWQQQVDVMQKKNASMREALAKVWGMEEGKNPFKTEGGHLPSEKKKKEEDKTMTGKPMTKVEIDPDMKEVKIGKKNVR